MSDLHARFTPLWGFVESSPAGIILEAPRDAKDGIGSALAVADADLLAEGPVRISWELLERWGGDEDWRDFWVMFLPPGGRDLQLNQMLGMVPHARSVWPHPMHYYRPTTRGFEIGEVTGGRPEDQRIQATWSGGLVPPASKYPFFSENDSAVVSADGSAVHIWLEQRGTISLPIGPRLLGLYAEASRVRVTVERG